jgi:hypothetical protein
MSVADHEIDEPNYDPGLCDMHGEICPCLHCASDEADRRYDMQREEQT